MVDVFVSYRQDERERIRPIADALRALEIEVWFDEQLTPGQSFTDEIDQVIRACKVHLVCWSAESVRSDWVRGEAEIGRKRGVLVAARIEPCDVPPPFNMLHTEDLSGWTGGVQHRGWAKILGAIGSKLGRPGLAELSQLRASSDATAWKRWARRYRDDPVAAEASAKADELEVDAVRARQARDRAAVPQPRAEEREGSNAPRVLPTRRGLERSTVGLLGAAVLVVVIAVVTMTRPHLPLGSPGTPPPRERERADSAAAARRALDEIPPPDWAIASSPALARRVLEATSGASLEAAAATGYAPAQVLLGAAHQSGIGDVQKDEAEAGRLYRLAAAQGNARGQDLLGSMYANGRGGLTKDDVEAVRLYRLAADQGLAAAQANLGVMYEHGRGGLAKDEVEAARLYRLAASRGNSLAEAHLGAMYEQGRGVAVDRATAVKLYQRAARQGQSTAQANLRRLGESW